MKHKFPYKWYLRDGYPAKGIEHHGCKVFGTFICGGGSTMGYKLAGYDHLGGVEIDPKVAAVYNANHHPKHLFVEDLRKFNATPNDQLPPELFNLDILDGSPPCSTFSMAGQRECAWGKRKQFAEGQALQTLDDLVFVYCDTIAKLHPKVCLLENVSGLIKGNAKAYAKRIVQRLESIGYRVQVFCLNAATMGVPQERERVFFIGLRKEYKLPLLKLEFCEPPILFGEVQEAEDYCNLPLRQKAWWDVRLKNDMCFGDIIARTEKRLSMFSNPIIHANRVCPTVTNSGFKSHALYDYPRKMTMSELYSVSTFPQDYKKDGTGGTFVTGMSVPPVMMAQIAHQIYLQWLSKH